MNLKFYNYNTVVTNNYNQNRDSSSKYKIMQALTVLEERKLQRKIGLYA